MIIFLGVLGELATIIGTGVITAFSASDGLIEIANNGYKINKDLYDNLQKEKDENTSTTLSIVKRTIGIANLIIPGVNLLNAGIRYWKVKTGIMKDPLIQECIIPMTEEEKEQYSKTTGRTQKLGLISFFAGHEKEEEFFGFINNTPIVLDHGLTTLFHDKLISSDYSLEEVKKLNDVTTYSYRIGKVDGKNIAIIGIPNPNSSVSRIQFSSDKTDAVHPYEKMTEEEASTKTFTVYPFIYNGEIKENIDKCVDEIMQLRKNAENKETVDTLQVKPAYESSTEEIAEGPLQEQQGPLLKKSLNRKH